MQLHGSLPFCPSQYLYFLGAKHCCLLVCEPVIAPQEGRVVEVGSHSELMQLKGGSGLYAEMWNRQAESSRQGMSAAPSQQSLAQEG